MKNTKIYIIVIAAISLIAASANFVISSSNPDGPSRTILNLSSAVDAVGLEASTASSTAASFQAVNAGDTSFQVFSDRLLGPGGNKVAYGDQFFTANTQSDKNLILVDYSDRINDVGRWGTVTTTPVPTGSANTMFDGSDLTFSTWAANDNPIIDIEFTTKGEVAFVAGAGSVFISVRSGTPESIAVNFQGSNGNTTINAENIGQRVYQAKLPVVAGSLNTNQLTITIQNSTSIEITEIDYVTDQGGGTNRYGVGNSVNSWRKFSFRSAVNAELAYLDGSNATPLFATTAKLDRVRDFNGSIGSPNEILSNNTSTRTDWIAPGSMVVTNPTGGANALQDCIDDTYSAISGTQTTSTNADIIASTTGITQYITLTTTSAAVSQTSAIIPPADASSQGHKITVHSVGGAGATLANRISTTSSDIRVEDGTDVSAVIVPYSQTFSVTCMLVGAGTYRWVLDRGSYVPFTGWAEDILTSGFNIRTAAASPMRLLMGSSNATFLVNNIAALTVNASNIQIPSAGIAQTDANALYVRGITDEYGIDKARPFLTVTEDAITGGGVGISGLEELRILTEKEIYQRTRFIAADLNSITSTADPAYAITGLAVTGLPAGRYEYKATIYHSKQGAGGNVRSDFEFLIGGTHENITSKFHVEGEGFVPVRLADGVFTGTEYASTSIYQTTVILNIEFTADGGSITPELEAEISAGLNYFINIHEGSTATVKRL